MLKKILAGVSAAAAFVALVASPTYAGTFGDLETLNPSGGTSAYDGIKIDYAAGSVQVTRNTYQQVFPAQSDVDGEPSSYCATGVLPDPDTQGCVSSAFVVSMVSDGAYSSMGTIVVGAPIPDDGIPSNPYGVYWDAITSESTVGPDGSGTIHSVMTYSFDWCNSGCWGTLTLDVVLSYTYPNQYYTVDTTTSWVNISGTPSSNDWFARVYYYEDAALSGSDEGNQFRVVDAAGNKLVGVIRPDKTALEGVRSYPTSPINTVAGLYYCPLWPGDADCVTAFGSTGWIADSLNLPNVVDSGEDVDNGFAVQAGAGAFSLSEDLTNTPATSKFDLLFMACEPTTTSVASCIDAGGYVPPALPNTGVDATSMPVLGATAIALAGVGVALLVIRRRRNA